jgi:redox-sensitive bicupin YhaK (pirin superfamily)
MKRLIEVKSDPGRHWVGDGFPVRSLFSCDGMGEQMSPFLLLDYAGPTQFPPSPGKRPRVGEHPHRGFETVTIVYQGSLEHRDSGGNHGKIGPGDVQWMTAASGVVHEEFHSEEFARLGGVLEMVQLWVNLPAAQKMPALNVWDVRLHGGRSAELAIADGHTTALVVLSGEVRVNGSTQVGTAELALFERAGERVSIECVDDAKALLLSGAPIDEPIVGRGPFVMKTQEEIRQAMLDYQSGGMGRL